MSSSFESSFVGELENIAKREALLSAEAALSALVGVAIVAALPEELTAAAVLELLKVALLSLLATLTVRSVFGSTAADLRNLSDRFQKEAKLITERSAPIAKAKNTITNNLIPDLKAWKPNCHCPRAGSPMSGSATGSFFLGAIPGSVPQAITHVRIENFTSSAAAVSSDIGSGGGRNVTVRIGGHSRRPNAQNGRM
jgi:hypothetical protein